MRVAEAREAFPRLQILGGLDKIALAQGMAAIDAALERVPWILERSGYIPYVDRRVPPNVSWENFVYYCKRLNEVTPTLHAHPAVRLDARAALPGIWTNLSDWQNPSARRCPDLPARFARRAFRRRWSATSATGMINSVDVFPSQIVTLAKAIRAFARVTRTREALVSSW